MRVIAVVTKRHREDTDKEEWALVSKKDPSKILQWFGTKKPSSEDIAKAEARVQYFKHQANLRSEVDQLIRRLLPRP